MAALDCSIDYRFENDAVLLRPLVMEDAEHLLPFSLNEPELWQFSLRSGAGKEALVEYIASAVTERQKGLEYPFIVFDKQQNSYAGSTRFYDIQLFHKTLQLGYTWYGKRFQGTGLNKACKYLLLQAAFEQFGMERVEFRADNGNDRSIAAMKSIGCIVEGVLRSHLIKHNGIRRDSIVLSILKPEWEGGVKEKLEQAISHSGNSTNLTT